MNIGFILLAIWLIISGLMQFIPGLGASPMPVVMGVLAIIAGILLLVGR